MTGVQTCALPILLGAVIITTKDGKIHFTDTEKALAAAAADFLGRQMESLLWNFREYKKQMKNQEYLKETYEWKDLLAIVHKLRQPDGCPWDSTQTYESMKKCVTDEAAEVVEAVDNEDFINLREELGDLMLQVLDRKSVV